MGFQFQAHIRWGWVDLGLHNSQMLRFDAFTGKEKKYRIIIIYEKDNKTNFNNFILYYTHIYLIVHNMRDGYPSFDR